jgi:hypothetical protein
MVCIVILAVFIPLYTEIVAQMPELAKPTAIRINNGYFFVIDGQSVVVYDLKTFKLVKKFCRQGEGPGELQRWPRIEFALDKPVISDSYKIILFSRDFEYLQEIKLETFSLCALPVGDGFVITEHKTVDKMEYYLYSLIDNKGLNIKEILRDPQDSQMRNYFLTPITKARSWQDKVYIAQPHKGFYIDVFDKQGKKLYSIEKGLKKIKAEEKHRQLLMAEVLFAVGRSRFEQAKKSGAFDRPLMEFVPAIDNFWVIDDLIYVKTHDITDTKQKYIIMDLKGNIRKELFLPIVYREILTFHNNTFYYLEDNEEEEIWVLNAVRL